MGEEIQKKVSDEEKKLPATGNMDENKKNNKKWEIENYSWELEAMRT